MAATVQCKRTLLLLMSPLSIPTLGLCSTAQMAAADSGVGVSFVCEPHAYMYACAVHTHTHTHTHTHKYLQPFMHANRAMHTFSYTSWETLVYPFCVLVTSVLAL